jgi:hypothetical protein
MIFVSNGLCIAWDDQFEPKRSHYLQPGDICLVIECGELDELSGIAITKGCIVHPCFGLVWAYLDRGKGTYFL